MSGRDSLAHPAARSSPRRPLATAAAGVTRGRRVDGAEAPQRPCAGANAVLFETDTGDARTWAAAAARCDRCPFLRSCRADLEQAHPDWGPGRRPGNPCAVVWAGLIFGSDRRLWTRRGLVRAVAVATGITTAGTRHDAPQPMPVVLAG